MQRIGEETHITTTEASGGVTHHGVRYVLLFSLLLAIAVLSAIWITGALTRDPYPAEPTKPIQAVGPQPAEASGSSLLGKMGVQA